MRKILLTLLLTVAMTAGAVPALRVWRTITQPDGTQMKVILVGDEHFHYYIDENKNAYTLDSAGYLRDLPESKIEKRQHAAVMRAKAMAPRRQQQFNPLSGKRKTLVILVNFKDKTFDNTLNNGNPKATFNAICNQEDYTNEWGAIGSVHKYFLDQSYNKFDINFDVVGPVTVSRNYSYYGANGSNGDIDLKAGDMVREAVKLVKDSVNFKDYDWDGDGYAEQIVCIYAGEGEATGGSANTIWPHQYYLSETSDGTVKLQGINIDNYLVLNEIVKTEIKSYTGGGIPRTYYETRLGGMGTLCHEFSHSLGLMDHYDTRENGGNYGMGSWDLMDYGSYGGPDDNGWVPTAMTAYERMFLGWLTPTELYDHRDSVKNMPYLQDSSSAYIIYNKNHTDEYFMLENKGHERWDSYLPDEGLLVTHVDYNKSAWTYNTVNAGKPQLMTVVPADNDYSRSRSTDSDGQLGMTFPYDSQNYLDSNYFVLNNRAEDGTYYLYCKVQGITVNDDGTINFGFVPDPRYEVATGLNRVSVSGAAAGGKVSQTYNLSGQRVDSSYHGIVIKDGKKYYQK